MNVLIKTGDAHMDVLILKEAISVHAPLDFGLQQINHVSVGRFFCQLLVGNLCHYIAWKDLNSIFFIWSF